MGAGAAVMRTVVDAVIVADRLPAPRRRVAKPRLRARIHHRLVPQLALGRDEGQLLALLSTPLRVALAEIVILLGLARRTARKSRKHHFFT